MSFRRDPGNDMRHDAVRSNDESGTEGAEKRRPYIDILQGRVAPDCQPLVGEDARRASWIVRTVTMSRLSSGS
jgi:hypothetical protein